MKKNLTAQIVFRTAYIAVAFIALLSSIGFWSIGTGKVNPNVNPYFFTDYFNWALVMSLIVSVVGLIENVNAVKDGKTEEFGGKTDQNRKSARVKARVKANELKGLINGAEQVVIMGHSNGDPDSFGSSIVPLLVSDYARVTLIDVRYVQIDVLDRFLEFGNQDVLFLYSTLVLNNSETIK